MTARLPDDPARCFCPVSDGDGEPPRIRIVVEGLAFGIPTALVARSAADGLAVADSLNRALGLDRDAWTGMPGPRSPGGACRPAGRTAAPCTEPHDAAPRHCRPAVVDGTRMSAPTAAGPCPIPASRHGRADPAGDGCCPGGGEALSPGERPERRREEGSRPDPGPGQGDSPMFHSGRVGHWRAHP